MPYFEIGVWFAIATAALLAVVCAGVVGRAVWLPGDVRRAACCGACGHPVGDMRVERCPECGALYSRAGVSTPRMVLRHRAGLGWALLAWTTMMLAVSAFFITQQQRRAAMRAWAAPPPPVAPGGGQEQITMDQDFSTWSPSAPGRSPFRAEVNVQAVTSDGLVESGTMTLRLRKTGTAERASLEMNMADGTFILQDQADKEVARGGPLEPGHIERLFALLEIGLTPNDSASYAEQFVEILQEARVDPQTLMSHNPGSISQGEVGLVATGGSSSSSPVGGFTAMAAMPPIPPWWTGLGVPGTILASVWIAGLAGITWRNRQLARALPSATR